MTKEPKTTLSRFFYKNINKVKKRNIIEEFDKSAHLYRIFMENKIFERRVNVKRERRGPQFKGFTDQDKKLSEIKNNLIDILIAQIERNIEESDDFFRFSKEVENCAILNLSEVKIEQNIDESNYFFGFSKDEINCAKLDPFLGRITNKIKELNDFFGFPKDEVNCTNIDLILATPNDIEEPNDFFGFSKDEIERANALCDKNEKHVEYFENTTPGGFKGFSKEAQNESILKLSYILEMCVSIRSEIYKNIDRRILSYHLKEKQSTREEMVCSKYWPKQEKLVAQLKEIKRIQTREASENSSKISRNFLKNNEMEIKTIKTESSKVKQENNLISDICKFNQAFGTNRLSPTKDIKLEEPPFIKIKNELIIPPFVPPKSPHNLIEEDLYHDPWALLIATIFLNKTCGRTARPYIFWFLEENPHPLVVLGKRVEELNTYFGAIGLQKTRANQVWRMSHDFIYKKWQKVSELYGIGRYGEEAFRMFCLGDFSFSPQDRYLKIYKAWYEMQDRTGRLQEMNI